MAKNNQIRPTLARALYSNLFLRYNIYICCTHFYKQTNHHHHRQTDNSWQYVDNIIILQPHTFEKFVVCFLTCWYSSFDAEGFLVRRARARMQRTCDQNRLGVSLLNCFGKWPIHLSSEQTLCVWENYAHPCASIISIIIIRVQIVMWMTKKKIL